LEDSHATGSIRIDSCYLLLDIHRRDVDQHCSGAEAIDTYVKEQMRRLQGDHTMNEKIGPYQVVELPPGRRVWVNALELSWPAHTMYGLLEVDVTVARKLIAEHKAHTGETLSFAGFLTFCLARAVDDDKTIQAYRKGSRQLVLFDDVNVGLMVERKVGEKRALMGHVIRAANRKTYREIHDEILNLTVLFDHDIVDGAPATRFTRRLVELMESGYGLDEDQGLTEVNTEQEALRTVPVPAWSRMVEKPQIIHL